MEFEASSILLYFAVFLIAAKVGGTLAIRLGQPEVLGELIAGILIGPSVAGAVTQSIFGFPLYVNPDASAGQFMALLGEVGIIILMFIAGLSIEVKEFRRAGRPSTIVATSGVAVAFLLGFGAASFFGWTPLEAGFAGGILVATSVGITVRTLMELHALHTKVGLTILGAAVIDDVLGIIILSVLSGMAFGSLSFFGIAEILVLMGVFFVVVLIFGFRVIPRVLLYASRFAADEIVLSITLAIVFLVSAMAERVRVAAITGAFLVGLITSKSPFADSIRGKAATVGYGLLIPLFFVNIGVETDLQALGAVGVLAVAFLAISIFSKIAGCGFGAVLSGFDVRDSLRVGVGMLPRAEVALIMASIGVRATVVGQSLLSMTVMVVLVTSLITPLLVKFAFKGVKREV